MLQAVIPGVVLGLVLFAIVVAAVVRMARNPYRPFHSGGSFSDESIDHRLSTFPNFPVPHVVPGGNGMMSNSSFTLDSGGGSGGVIVNSGGGGVGGGGGGGRRVESPAQLHLTGPTPILSAGVSDLPDCELAPKGRFGRLTPGRGGARLR